MVHTQALTTTSSLKTAVGRSTWGCQGAIARRRRGIFTRESREEWERARASNAALAPHTEQPQGGCTRARTHGAVNEYWVERGTGAAKAAIARRRRGEIEMSVAWSSRRSEGVKAALAPHKQQRQGGGGGTEDFLTRSCHGSTTLQVEVWCTSGRDEGRPRPHTLLCAQEYYCKSSYRGGEREGGLCTRPCQVAHFLLTSVPTDAGTHTHTQGAVQVLHTHTVLSSTSCRKAHSQSHSLSISPQCVCCERASTKKARRHRPANAWGVDGWGGHG